jgi:methylmalonyl-CoA mutase
MADPHIADSAALPSFEDWRRLVESALKGAGIASLRSHTRDGILIEPLYPVRDDVDPLLARGGRRWSIVQLVDDPDPDSANEHALADIRGGATALALRFSGAAAAVSDGLPATEEALRFALQEIDLAKVGVRIDAHRDGPQIARWLADLVARRGIAPERTKMAFGLDPIGVMAFHGGIETSSDAECVSCFGELRSGLFGGRLAALDGRVFHEAGASEAQELSAILAAAVWWLRELDRVGAAADAALPHFEAIVAVDVDQFASIAKLRALRLLWARLQELCGVPPAPLAVHAETSRRMLTRADPHTNLLRTTLAAFAAGVGGADSIAILPYTAAIGRPDREARALARNIQHILIQEAQLDRVSDPAAGSGAVEALTDALAERAWQEFQAVEREGGIVESLRSGAFSSRVATSREALKRAVAEGVLPLVGATVFRPEGERLADMPVWAGNAGPFAAIRLEAFAEAVS